MNPDISILVPVYNVAKYMERCAVSLFEQTLEHIEYIFLDDCSPDNSMEILQNVISRYPQRASHVQIIRHDRNRGLAAARNTLVEHAAGRYILHVDSDDYVEKNCAELLFMKATTESADIVISDIFREKKSSTTIQRVRFSPDKTTYINLVLASLSPSYNCGKLINTDLYLKHQIRCKEGINVLEDYHTLPRLAYYANKIVKVDTPLYHYVQYNENAYTKHFNEQFISNVCEAIEIVESFFRSKEDGKKYEKGIEAFKIMTKINNIKNADSTLQKQIMNLFPNVTLKGNQEMLRLSFIDKLIFLLIQKRQSMLIDIITSGIKRAKKLKSKVMQIQSANNETQ
ncbi:MAG: glycosyltransferase family 2 protein [Microbacter sp.]